MIANKLALGTLVFFMTAAAGISAPAHAAQGQGQLAQYPLNLGAPVPAAFIMAVDDSGSMTFETMFPGRDGHACWSGSSFFDNSGNLRTSGTCNYNHLIPYTGHRIDTGRHAIPPIDTFGFARSHEFNPSYFDPSVQYLPWLNSDGTPYGATPANPQGNASITATRVDPRNAAPTINMTQLRQESTALGFRVLNNMVIPTGAAYRTNNNNNWTVRSSDLTWTSGTNNNVAFRYFPAKFYLRTSTPAPAGFRTNIVQPNQTGGRILARNACGSGCDMYRYEIRPENYTSTAAYNAAIQNFANWFSFYGNRNRAMIAGMSHALAEVQNMRIGYFTINRRPGNSNLPMHDMSSASARRSLFEQVFSLPASGGTPNLLAVEAIGNQFRRTDVNAPVQLACQRNAGMLFTDGYSNQGSPEVAGRTMGAPFDPVHSNSLAAIAAKHYAENLRTDLGLGKVPVPAGCNTDNPDPRLDCRRDPHMNFYGVTLGARGEFYDPDETRDPFEAPHPAWRGHANDDPRTVDDIWQATLLSRGEFINARTPADITEAMRRVLASVGGGESPSGTLGLTGARVGESSFTVTPSFTSTNNGTDWYSRLVAERPVATGGQISYTQLWDAANRLPAPTVRAQRTVVGVGHGNNTPKPNLAPFGPAAFGANDTARRSLLCSNTRATCSVSDLTGLGSVQDFLSYLMGDASREVRNGGTFRDRTTPLGDIVNSTPVIASPRDNYGYAGLAGTEQDPLRYRDYLTRKADRAPLVLVGANDGMFHAFNGDNGAEVFAYIPTTAVGHLGNLGFPYRPEDRDNQKFQHRYYVDGPVTVSDAYFGPNDWRTVAVGTAGAGGRGVFALDISNPSSFSANAVLWEISDQMQGREVWRDIGHVVGKPVIVPVLRGDTPTWVAIFGNGYGSDNNDAVLFVVDLRTGDTRTIRATHTLGVDKDSVQNGLGNIIVLDRWSRAQNGTQFAGTDGYADTVYGADQRGNIWKFDLRDDSLAYDEPLFTATDDRGEPQAITGGLEAATGPGGGVMLYFGTGSFSFENDRVDTSLQRFYGIWDNGEPVTRPLQRQTLSASATDADVRNVTASAVNYMSHAGWYLDLALVQNERATLAGERFVGYPRLQNGIVFFTTFEPGSSDACAGGGRNWLYALNALSGLPSLGNLRIGSPTASPLGEPAGGVALETGGDAPVTEIAVVLPPPPQALGAGATAEQIEAELNRTCDLVVQTAGSQPMYLARGCGRQSWRQIR